MECPICESPNLLSHYLVKGFDVVECRNCSQIFVPTPAPEFIAAHADSFNGTRVDAGLYYNYRSELSSHLLTFDKRLDEIEKLLSKKGRALDVGCALGHFGEAAKRRDWDVYVSDVSEYVVHEARNEFDLNGFIMAPDKLPVKSGLFDLVTMYDVVERLSHPMDLLREASRVLSPNGLLHLTTPNAQSLSARIMGKYWYHFKPNENFLYFTPETLKSVLQRSGFEVLKIKPATCYFRISDIFLRLERYNKRIFGFLNSLVRKFGLGDFRVLAFTGEIQAFAKPAHKKIPIEVHQIVDILDIVCCIKCKSQIQLFEENEAICTQCEQSFEVLNGVINFSKYAKRGKRRFIGSS